MLAPSLPKPKTIPRMGPPVPAKIRAQQRLTNAATGGDIASQTDLRRGDRNKQSQPYINDLQYARNVRERGGKGYKPNIFSTTRHGADAIRAAEADANTRNTVGYEGESGVGPALAAGSGTSVGAGLRQGGLDALARVALYKATHGGQLPPPASQPKPQQGLVNRGGKLQFLPEVHPDEPRTDTELRHFLETGHRPIVSEKLNVNTGGGGPVGQLAAPGLWTLRQTARVGHGVVGGLEGKNVAHEFLHGHDTASDLLKHLGLHDKTAATLLGLPLDYYLFGGPAKLGLRSEAAKLEQAAGRAEAGGNAARASALRARTQTAPTNRGLGVGATVGIPFTGRRLEATVGEKTTSAISRKLHIPGAARRLHDSGPVQKAGPAIVRNFRPRDQPPAYHQGDVQLQRQRSHDLARGEEIGKHRATAYENALDKVPPATREEVSAAIERAPHEPITRVKVRRLLAPQHKAFNLAKRRLQTADRKLAREQGRWEVSQTPANARRLSKAVDAKYQATQSLTAAKDATKGVARRTREVVVPGSAPAGRKLLTVDQVIAKARAEGKAFTPDQLPPELRPVAEQHAAEMKGYEQRLVDADLLRSADAKPFYLHHAQTPPLPGTRLKFGRRGRPANAAPLRHRADPRDVRSQRIAAEQQGRQAPFETDPTRANFAYVTASERALADSEYLKGLHAHAVGSFGDVTPGRIDSIASHPDRTIVEFTPKGIVAFQDRHGYLDVKAAKEALHNGSQLAILPKSVAARELASRGAGIDVSPAAEAMRSLGRGWNKAQGFWKSGVTVWNLPFYQERNVMDDSFRSWLGDTDFRSYKDAAIAMTKVVRLRRGERQLIPTAPGGTINVGRHGVMTWPDFLRQAFRHGVGAGYNQGEVLGQLGNMRGVGLNRVATNVSHLGELVPRMATLLGALRRGMSWQDAAAWTRLHHFAYDELSALEQKIRGIIPFYTFTSRNTALQLRKVLSRPGKYAAIEAWRQEAAKSLGLPPDWENNLPETDQRAIPIPMRFGNTVKILLPGFSLTDLNRNPLAGVAMGESPKQALDQQFDLSMAMLSPFIKSGVEFFSNHSFFFRGPIVPDKNNPNIEAWAPAPSWYPQVAKTLGLPAQAAWSFRDGHTGPGWPRWFDYFVRQMPQSGFVATLSTNSLNSRDQSFGDRLFGQLTGIRRKGLQPAEDKALIQRIYTRLSEITLAENAMTPKQKLAPVPGNYASRQLQGLRDEAKRLTTLLATLEGKAPKQPILSRPPTPRQQLDQQVQKIKHPTQTPRQQLDQQLQRLKGKQAIQQGGG